jgi:glycosyltransferase involved in cell wall biosynthesis
MTPLRVAIDGRFVAGSDGGVESVVVGLAEGLLAAKPVDVAVTFVTYAGQNDWLRQSSGGAFNILEVPPPAGRQRALRRARPWALRPAARSVSLLPPRDKVMETAGAEVVHLPFQGRGWVRQPYIYHPHDLQHRHLPHNFTRRQLAWRELVYADLCKRASVVAVGTSWVKQDLIDQMNVPEKKIAVVPLAPIRAARQSPFRRPLLPAHFVIYPAATWPHKNHVGLFKALALLRAQGLDVNVVLTGARPGTGNLLDLAAASGVSDLVTDLGFVEQSDLERLISMARVMVVPTLFEAASFPIWESFRLGTAVVCSTVTSLPKQVGEAAVTFDPYSVEDMATAIHRVWADDTLRLRLVESGRHRLKDLSWERTATHFLAIYKKLGGRPLSDEERALLTSTPLL